MILTKSKKAKIKDVCIASFFIAIGTLVGLISLFLFYLFNLAIFGFNIGLILSPLIAGYTETYLVKKLHGKTLGAISAFILFAVTVFYGFIYINKGLGLNLISVGGAAVILQAAFPTFVNYFLIVVVLGTISYILGIFKQLIDEFHLILRKIYFKILKREYVEETSVMDYDIGIDRININNLGILILSTSSISHKKIAEFKGIYEGKILIKNQKTLINKKGVDKGELLLKNLRKARQQALVNLANTAKINDCNGILDLTIEFDTLGGLKEDNIHIVARGTGVKFES